jgi:transcriptional regulator NrdR family protein
MLDHYIKRAAESRATAIEAAIHRFRDCGVEIERFSIQEHSDMTTMLCIDGVPRFSWRITCELPGWNGERFPYR